LPMFHLAYEISVGKMQPFLGKQNVLIAYRYVALLSIFTNLEKVHFNNLTKALTVHCTE
jgi:hypothetical protein